MKNFSDRQRFIELRSQGLSYDKIALIIKTSKPTLLEWGKTYDKLIIEKKNLYAQKIIEQAAATKLDQLNFLTEIQNRIKPIVRNLTYDDIRSDKLWNIYHQNNARINELSNEFSNSSETTEEINISELDKFLEIDAEIKKDYENAIALFKAGDYQNSIVTFEKVIKINPHFEETWLYVTKSFFKLNLREKALQAAEMYLSYNCSKEIFLIMGEIHFLNKNTNTALISIERGLERYPLDALLNHNAGIYSWFCKKPNQAMDYLKKSSKFLKDEKDPEIKELILNELIYYVQSANQIMAEMKSKPLSIEGSETKVAKEEPNDNKDSQKITSIETDDTQEETISLLEEKLKHVEEENQEPQNEPLTDPDPDITSEESKMMCMTKRQFFINKKKYPYFYKQYFYPQKAPQLSFN